MSKEYRAFREETGETAFLAGAVDALSDTLSLVCNLGFAFDADIFYTSNHDFTALDDAVKNRLKAYTQYEHNPHVKQHNIEQIHFELEKVEEDVTGYVCKTFQSYSCDKNLKEILSQFFLDLNWHLQKPVCIYKPSSQCVKKTLDILGHVYLYMAWEYFFIAYEKYMVLFIFGTID